ncbi:DUF3105 domain-containing protein [Deinococcus enclensis]|uniref:DUF3105 domain-containing protein n=1 Tax=Deinococcus enclensis TaxID=1049582 RepID=A0ABT9MF60_9DEIO|nr:DUF3105 domain-containing protein [Deinococcus enclensis]MDP9765190.1 hypothetical protein [Deinococcus enclensis]
MKRLLLAALLLTACTREPALDGVQTFTYEGGDHREGPIEYAESPPAGGPHNPRWQNCGIYTGELHDEYAVHSLEHGAVWVTYTPAVSPADVRLLQEALDGRTHVLLSPRSEQDAPIVMTAWNAQLELQRADDPRVTRFIQVYEQGGTAPENGASCSGAYSETK